MTASTVTSLCNEILMQLDKFSESIFNFVLTNFPYLLSIICLLRIWLIFQIEMTE